MKWVALSIILFVGFYTFITLRFRKPGKAFEPYEAAHERAVVHQLAEAGYQRILATASLPADPRHSAASLARPDASSQPVAGGLPPELGKLLAEKPRLPDDIANVTAPTSVAALLPYAFQFTCATPDKTFSVGDTFVYVKGSDIAVVTGLEHNEGDLLARSRDNPVLVSIPGGTLKPGQYRVRLIGQHRSREWTMLVH